MERSEERNQFLDDIIEGANYGCAYWARGEIIDGIQYIWDFEEPEERHALTREVVEKGIHILLDEANSKLNTQIRKNIWCGNIDNDACDIDAECCDVIVQAGIFGEIIFG